MAHEHNGDCCGQHEHPAEQIHQLAHHVGHVCCAGCEHGVVSSFHQNEALFAVRQAESRFEPFDDTTATKKKKKKKKQYHGLLRLLEETA